MKGLAYFVETAKARSLWRFVVRTAYRIPDGAQRKEIIAFARAEFEQNNSVEDPEKIRYLVSIGTKQANDMAKYLNIL